MNSLVIYNFKGTFIIVLGSNNWHKIFSKNISVNKIITLIKTQDDFCIFEGIEFSILDNIIQAL